MIEFNKQQDNKEKICTFDLKIYYCLLSLAIVMLCGHC